ncbi:MAG: phytanoyl-CoA dioxygenase family protein [Bacteroidetes bacterium]|nr:phytanoyl-CoA dioxygenase family protein [Bacteroidota bacterium]
MGIKGKIKQLKLTHWFYNLLHYKSLLHNKAAYKKYNIHKPLIASISSKDFPDKASRAWLDVGDSKKLVALKDDFKDFPDDLQQQLASWSENGYIFLKGFFDEATVESVNHEIEKLVQQKKLYPTHDNKLMFANRISPLIKNITLQKQLTGILSFILDKEVVPFQTINFIYGSNQRAHSDSIHMTTYPLGYLIAVWIALEDTTMNNGPLFYYPGSHKMPYLLNNDFNEGETALALGKKEYSDYEDVIEKAIAKKNFEKKVFLAKKGDAFVWHANLVHGGLPVEDPKQTRKSMVIHYYAKDVIKYHEISERPSLMED